MFTPCCSPKWRGKKGEGAIMLLMFTSLTVRFLYDIITLTTHKQILKLTREFWNPLTRTKLCKTLLVLKPVCVQN